MTFDSIKIHCSSLGYLFTEPREKAKKDAGELSASAKEHLYKVYIEQYWGRKRQLSNKQVRKGLIVEPQSIQLISLLDGVLYEKNEESRENEYIIGTPDIVTETQIQDVKSSYDAETFIPMLLDPLEKMYDYQMQGYLWLFDKDEALVRRCLISTPQEIVEEEKYYLLKSMNVATEENPEYKRRSAELEYNLTFEDIPLSEREITHKVPRNEQIIEAIPSKVGKAREFLNFLHKIHTKQ